MSPARGSRGGGPSGGKPGREGPSRAAEAAGSAGPELGPAPAPAGQGALLGGGPAPAGPLEHSVRVVLTNRYGLHMRPAKRVMELAHSFPCEIDLVAKGQEVDAKSILGIIGLGAECGDEVSVRARGPGAKDAAEAVGKLLSSLPELHGEPRDAR